MNEDNDAITTALQSRRIPHARSRNNRRGGAGKGKGKDAGGSVFNPLRALGFYEVQLGSKIKPAEYQNEGGRSSSSWLEIHELTEGENGLLGTLEFKHKDGDISGMCVLAGSRKTLNEIVVELENADDEDEDYDESEDRDENKDGHEVEDEQKSLHDNKEGSNNESDDIKDDKDGNRELTALEAADEKLNRRHQAFEKNSFRNPKFWMRWKGHYHAHPQAAATTTTAPSHRQVPAATEGTDATSEEAVVDDNTTENRDMTFPSTLATDQGYLIFSANDCARFEGTISCRGLGWDNVKMRGWKTRSKARPLSWRWMDLGETNAGER